MHLGVRRLFLGATAIAVTCLTGAAGAAGQAGAAPEHVQMAEEAFKTITILKGVPVDTFFDTMGEFANALGNDCTYCHASQAYFDKTKFAEQTPNMARARQMWQMMNALNKTYFKGAQRVTCFTCHNGSENPKSEPNLMLQYGVPVENPDARSLFPDDSFTAAEVFDKYVKALGGADKLAKFTSYAAKGTYAGFDTAKNKIPVDIVGTAKGPQINTVMHMFNGDSLRTYDGKRGWMAGPDTPMPLVELVSGNLDRIRIEAMLPFGTELSKTFTEWKTARSSIDDKPVRVVQGVRDGEVQANYYFDEAGLLVRAIRWNHTPVTWVPTHIDLSDYRELPGLGVKFPYKKIVSQTYMQMAIELSQIQPNVAIPAEKFAQPKPGR